MARRLLWFQRDAPTARIGSGEGWHCAIIRRLERCPWRIRFERLTAPQQSGKRITRTPGRMPPRIKRPTPMGVPEARSTSKNGNTAYTQHQTTAQGSVGTVQTSTGGQGAAASGANGNSAAVGQTANGNKYATANGNVYKNTGSGWKQTQGTANSQLLRDAEQLCRFSRLRRAGKEQRGICLRRRR